MEGQERSAQPSIHSSAPSEEGGTRARRGFAYQDHIAVAFYLELLSNTELSSVWSETYDDITLIWNRSGQESVEFVQVKSDELSQLWSAAVVCAVRDGGKSIYEKSLGQDRFAEPCTFRLVTAWQLMPNLAVLKLPLGHADRVPGHARIEAVVETLRSHAHRPFVSIKGNDVTFWVRHLFWDVRESLSAVEAANYRTLDHFFAREGAFLLPDQKIRLYEKLLFLAKTAAELPWTVGQPRKKLSRNGFLGYIREEIERASNPSTDLQHTTLRTKMVRAGLAEAVIGSAIEARRAYRQATLEGKFLAIDDRTHAENEVRARLHEVLVALYSGTISESSAHFHTRCVAILRDLHEHLPSRPPLSMLQGMMYDITARCLHQFTSLSSEDLPPLVSPS